MMKLVIFNTPEEYMEAFIVKFISHIHNPTIMEMKKNPEAANLQTPENFLVFAKGAVDHYPEDPLLFVVQKFTDDIATLEKHFNIFQVWDDPTGVDITKHEHGIWIHDPSETDYLFNNVIPWVFS